MSEEEIIRKASNEIALHARARFSLARALRIDAFRRRASSRNNIISGIWHQWRPSALAAYQWRISMAKKKKKKKKKMAACGVAAMQRRESASTAAAQATGSYRDAASDARIGSTRQRWHRVARGALLWRTPSAAWTTAGASGSSRSRA
jgi:hypothetical protein